MTVVGASSDVEETDDVSDEVELRVRLDRFGGVGLAVPSLVGRDDVVAGIGQRAELVAPRVPALGESVAQHDERAVGRARLGDVHADAVGVDEAVGDVGHRAMLGGRAIRSRRDAG